jgi:hypothetical protein
VDREQLERFAGQPEVLRDPGDYTLRIEEVQMAEDRLSIRPLAPGSLTPGGVSATSPDIASGGAIDVGLRQAGGSKVAATDA